MIDTTNLEERQDRDRRREEEALLALLLLLMSQAENRAASAFALGANPYAAAADVFTGNAALRMSPAWPRIARKLQAADVAGSRRVALVTGIDIQLKPTADYAALARQAAARLLQHANAAITAAVREAAAKGVSARRTLGPAFTAAGLVQSATSKAWLLETTAVTLVGFAFNGGWFNGFAHPDVSTQIKGWRFSATLDSRTTEICRARHGTKVTANDVWRTWNTPPLHFNCRSVLLPIFRDFEPTPQPPVVPAPMAGFGRAPAVNIGLRYTRVA